MSLTASMWTGVSGLLAHGDKMNIIGNNIANVNTIGFKSQRMDFADMMYFDKYGNGGLEQVGNGVSTSKIITSFHQGPYESTTNPTDLAISGSGFFQVKKQNSDQMYYSRAGNFTFDKAGNLVDPNNYVLQGWKINNDGGVTRSSGGLSGNEGDIKSDVLGTGAPQDVKLDAWTIAPFATSKMTYKVNLSKNEGKDSAVNNTNPFAGLMNLWNGKQPPATATTPPIPQEGYSYQTTQNVYDEAGVKHKITIYFDKVSDNDYTGGENGGSMWEYMVTMDPAEDKRQFFDYDPNINPDKGIIRNMSDTKMGGILGSGTLSFNSAGQVVNQSLYTLLGDKTPEEYKDSFAPVWDPNDPGAQKYLPKMNSGGWITNPAFNPANPVGPGNLEFIVDNNQKNSVENLENWRSAGVSASGYPIVVPNFTGIIDAQTSGSPNGAKYGIEMSFGMKASNLENPWTHTDSSLADLTVDAYTFNTVHNPANPATGPKYYLNNLQYQYNTLGTVTSLLNKAQTDWDAAGFVGAGGVAVKFEDVFYKNPPTAIATINGVTAPFVLPNNPNHDTAGTAFATPSEYAQHILASLNSLMAPTSGAAGAPHLIDTLFKYEFTDGTVPLGTAIAAGGAPANIPAVNLPSTGSPLMSYLKEIRDKGTSSLANLSGFASANPANAQNLAQIAKPVIIEESGTQSQAGPSATYNQSQNGYGFGDLASYHVDQRGVLSGVYSNGITMPLYQIVLYDFTSTQNLRREGGNVFSQTLESGDPKSGPPGVAGLGKITSNTIEQSNVDMAREFVLMITTQRGFQGNSKTITTVDTMLESVINLKR